MGIYMISIRSVLYNFINKIPLPILGIFNIFPTKVDKYWVKVFHISPTIIIVF